MTDKEKVAELLALCHRKGDRLTECNHLKTAQSLGAALKAEADRIVSGNW